MADEIHIDYDSGKTLYAVIRNAAGQVWHISGQGFENWGTNGRDADDYDIALTDKSGNRYVGDFDGNVPAGRYTVQIFLQLGASTADGDELLGSGEILWNGTSEVRADKILANKAVQNKSSGAIDYYDDDGQSVLLRHTPSETESEITRTPS